MLHLQGDIQRPTYQGMAPGNGHYYPALIEKTKMGGYGYDPEIGDMRGIFYAKGPGKKLHK